SLLTGLERLHHLGDAPAAGFRPPGALDPADVVVAIEGRDGLEEGAGSRLRGEGGGNVLGNRLDVVTVRSQDPLIAGPSAHVDVTEPGRADRENTAGPVGVEAAPEAVVVDRAGDIVPLLCAPHFVRIEGNHKVGPGAGSHERCMEALGSHWHQAYVFSGLI